MRTSVVALTPTVWDMQADMATYLIGELEAPLLLELLKNGLEKYVRIPLTDLQISP
jgi:hypothetical protein